MRWALRLIAYAIVGLFALADAAMNRLNDKLLARGPASPNESAGEVWEIVYRGNISRYVKFGDYLLYYAPFAIRARQKGP